MAADPDLDGFELYAYVGEDELGSGAFGLKQAFAPVGLVPLVSTSRASLEDERFRSQIAEQARLYGKPIRLVRLVYAESVETIRRLKPALATGRSDAPARLAFSERARRATRTTRRSCSPGRRTAAVPSR